MIVTENEACILREVTDGLLRREIWIQANAEDDPRTLQKVDAGNNKCEINIYIESIDKTDIPHIKEYEDALNTAIE
jgi:hypothetical protein